MNGYIALPTSGTYNLSLEYIDNLGIINRESNSYNSPNCCDNYTLTGNVDGDNNVKSIWASDGPTGTNEIVVDLVANVAYPIEFFYVNKGGPAGMRFTYTDPIGTTHQNLDDFMYHLSSEATCSYVEKHLTTIEWDQTSTATSTSLSSEQVTETNFYLTSSPITFPGTLVEETDYVYVPMSRVTNDWYYYYDFNNCWY